ncbi:hypothetical protein AAVH_35631, partial [Aphelenchoides avenae]
IAYDGVKQFVPLPESDTYDHRMSDCEMTHVNVHGKAKMVDVTHKQPTVRIAMAEAAINLSPEIMERLLNNTNKKGDALAVSRVAGIIAAKKTSDLIPLCHNIPLSDVQVKFRLDQACGRIIIYARVKTRSETGVEMEALTACTITALTVYDMCKSVSHHMALGPIRLVGKCGGKRDFGRVEFDELDYASTVEI